MSRSLAAGLLIVSALGTGCGSTPARRPAGGDEPAPVRPVPAAARPDSSAPARTPPTRTTGGTPARPTPPATPPAPVAVATPADLPSAQMARRSALLADSVRLGADEIGYYMDVQEAKLRQLIPLGYGVTRRDSALIVLIPGRLTFDVGSARLLPSGLEAISTLGKVLAEYDRSVITLHGYTDSSGEPASNASLSQARAISLARQFLADGVAANRVIVVGHGAADPIVDNATPEGREENRRIEVRIDPVRR